VDEQFNIGFRPSTPDQLIGYSKEEMAAIQERVSKARSVLFSGPTGTGKTTLALALASTFTVPENIKQVNCGDENGIAEMRKLIEVASKRTLNGKPRVFIIDEVHKATPAAQDALLIPMEAAKSSSKFLFATNEPERLKPVFLRRCLKINTPEWTEKRLLRVAKRVHKATGLPIPKDLSIFENPSDLLTFMELPNKVAAESRKNTTQAARVVLAAMLGTPTNHKLFDFKYASIMEISLACRALMGVTISWEKPDVELVKMLRKQDPRLVAKIGNACATALRDDTRPVMVLLDILMGSVANAIHFEGK
jgi:energy-coupling factor transporter ATP-binding protein EcfA2